MAILLSGRRLPSRHQSARGGDAADGSAGRQNRDIDILDGELSGVDGIVRVDVARCHFGRRRQSRRRRRKGSPIRHLILADY